ncbi:MAG: N-6 DNA methylase [Bradyrhizobium sp.]|uniref:N-6 DNA methylase n=1 Tax=Bradyrhizobium sp. TaxID=376 RepID=UPI0029AB165A|nr:N-6 DNA methylase [Bradyrhizobium sp.]MDX3968136.1 N-6 DNA methylase [Bradyrhizobium sp.]
MREELAPAKEMIRRCLALRDLGRPEAVLRSEVQSGLRVVFPDTEDKSWIDHYVEGTEAHAKIAKSSGGLATRFIDNLIGSTTIEYESDLRNFFKREVGLSQVKEHVTALIRRGIPRSRIRGILSDTVEWYAYEVLVSEGLDPKECTPQDVTLIALDELQLQDDSDASAGRLIQFIRKHLARQQSRSLRAEYLTLDLGLDSGTYQRHSPQLLKLVSDGRNADTSIALATDLWLRFIDHLEGEAGAFRVQGYVDEVYVAILARLLSANVLAGHAISSDDAQLASILDGSHFRNVYQLQNIVEQDYFGWLIRPQNLPALIPIARELQHDLYAYDFNHREEEDIFGRLMAQLARKSQRKLLGQEWTPAWLAKLLAERCIENLPPQEAPRIVDMCCGSGSIIAEVLKAARSKLGLTTIQALNDVITGFDIDPLAVALSKTTWVITLAAEIKASSAPIIVPIYQADSLFAVTPVSSNIPLIDEDRPIDVLLDGAIVQLPHSLVRPEYRDLFDRIVDWAYDEAINAREQGDSGALIEKDAANFIDGTTKAAGLSLPDEFRSALYASAFALAARMSKLAVQNRNGIWAFVLRNTYRPGLLSGQFNGLVSNPPWLAMSGLADNPYREMLTERAKLYGIRPSGQSFLHLELGTMHLIHAVDRYLKADASVACLVPGTLFNGHHHEPFRQGQFLKGMRPVALEIASVWQVASGTFKYPSAAIIGYKRGSLTGLSAIPHSAATADRDGLRSSGFSVTSIGKRRSAWVLDNEGKAISANTEAMPPQGADLMPRTAVCVDVLKECGAEWHVDTPRLGSQWFFAVKAAKELKDARFTGHVASKFIHSMAQSENLLPFVLGAHRARIAIPAAHENGRWQIYSDTEIRRQGFTETARRFASINMRLAQVGKGKSLQERIDERGKLSRQVFGPDDAFIVLSGAGGKDVCAACISTNEAQSLAIDQTLYWQIFAYEQAAMYTTGMLNSEALTRAITPFNPKGDFAERHIHTLPYKMVPVFDSKNVDHVSIATLAGCVTKEARTIIEGDALLKNPTRALSARRRRLRLKLRESASFQKLDALCASILSSAEL